MKVMLNYSRFNYDQVFSNPSIPNSYRSSRFCFKLDFWKFKTVCVQWHNDAAVKSSSSSSVQRSKFMLYPCIFIRVFNWQFIFNIYATVLYINIFLHQYVLHQIYFSLSNAQCAVLFPIKHSKVDAISYINTHNIIHTLDQFTKRQ